MWGKITRKSGQKWILPLRELQPNVGADSISARNGDIRPKWMQTGQKWMQTGQKWMQTGQKWMQTGQKWMQTGQKWILPLLVAVIFTTGACTMQQGIKTTQVAADVVALSAATEALQQALGEYSEQQDVMADCTQLTASIRAALHGNISKLLLTRYMSRAEIIYTAVKEEVVRRWSEIPTAHRNSLISLEADYLSLRARINSLIEEVVADNSYNQTAVDLLRFATALANAYTTYQEYR